MTQEKNKKEQYLIDSINRAINELVYDKVQLIKAYNYYHGKRDPEQFRHLEENYGLGTPTSIEFVPLTRKHIDVLVGEYLSTPLIPRISCKDKETVSNIHKEKEVEINNRMAQELNKYLRDSITSIINGTQPPTPIEVEEKLNKEDENINQNFISKYEIAAQNIVDWAMQSRNIDFTNQRKLLLIDLLVTGTGYYKISPSSEETNINLEILNPINTFIDRNPESPYLKNSSRAVIRKYLTKDQILSKYGDLLSEEDIKLLENKKDYADDGSVTSYIRSYDNVTGNTISDGILGGFEVTPLVPFERSMSKNYRVLPVYEVEWLKTEKEGSEYIVNRYEGVRIGTDIYILIGKSKNVTRSIDNPKLCSLSINGIFYSDRNGEPYSLILKTANLQDKNDILLFYRDNLISESGSSGDWLDVAHLPTFLGSTIQERLMKWKAYKKQGLALYDSSQEGSPMLNTTFSGYDNTIKFDAINAIDLAIQRNEEMCSLITGVFREKLGGVEQKDAVTNVQLGVRQSTYITKQYYQIMDLMTREMLLDILNNCKIVFKKGISGTLILGDRLNKIFTALPEYYTVTDHDINISDSTDIIKEQEIIKLLSIELTKNNVIDPDILLEVVTATGLTRMKADVKSALNQRKKENNQLGQLSQQVEQLSQELKQTTSEAQKLQNQVNQLNAEKLKLEQDRLQYEKELEWFKAKDQSSYNASKLEWEKKRVQLEAVQLLDDNSRNDEIKNE